MLISAAGIALFSWLAVRWILLGGLGHRTRQRGIQFLARTRRKLRDTWMDAREVFRLIAVRGRWWLETARGGLACNAMVVSLGLAGGFREPK